MMIREWGAPTPKHIAKVCAALADDRCSTIRMLAKWFHIDKETICKIIVKYLGEKSCVRDLLPHVLMLNQREDHVRAVKNLLIFFMDENQFFRFP